MIIHINKDRLSNTFSCKSGNYDILTDDMLNDLLDSESMEDFRMEYPESYEHFCIHFKDKIISTNPDYEDILFEVFSITLDDEDYYDEDDDEY